VKYVEATTTTIH